METKLAGPLGAALAPAVPELAPTARAQQPKFSHELQELARQFADRPARLSELLAATQGRGFDLFLLLISLPFATPIPLPGLSTPFGFVILIIGARLALGRRPWLPQTLLQRELPAKFIAKVLTAAGRMVRGGKSCSVRDWISYTSNGSIGALPAPSSCCRVCCFCCRCPFR